tara:strand:+ start:322 stop:549 length:228 start_codon:yes stop_codon:yes gene_type:complete
LHRYPSDSKVSPSNEYGSCSRGAVKEKLSFIATFLTKYKRMPDIILWPNPAYTEFSTIGEEYVSKETEIDRHTRE